MWALRTLNITGDGEIYNLKMGRNRIGRNQQCEIVLTSPGISKEHAEIHVYKDKILLVDLRSSNGTFLNGVRIQNGIVRMGDKIGLHDLIFDIVPASMGVIESAPQSASQAPFQTSQPPATIYDGSAAPAYSPQVYQTMQAPALAMAPEIASPMPDPTPLPPEGFVARADEYFERVALPGVYKLAEILEFRMVLGTFIIVFIIAVTLLSMIPMVQITRSSITRESMRRASSLARTLAQVNQQALLQGSYSALSTHSVETEDGIKRALIVQQSDGVILAPSSQAGNSPDLPFVLTARRETKPQVEAIDGSTIGASFPIGAYDPNTGEPIVKAHAVILYDIGSLAFDDGRVLSLFFQTLVIAAILGLIVFYFMYRLIERPVASLNESLDIALREKRDSVESPILFPPLQALIGNINSLLNRAVHGDGDVGGGSSLGKEAEAVNLLYWVGIPAVTLRADGTIIACNIGFEQLARNTSEGMAQRGLEAIGDMALQQNIDHLMAKAQENTHSVHSDQLEFGGQLCVLNCQAFTTDGQVDYYVVTIGPLTGGGAE